MKVLIADSGSTKCDWLAITEHGQELHEFHTMGFNPYFHDADLVEREMKGNAQATWRILSIVSTSTAQARVHRELCEVIAEGLRRVFVHAEVHVGHDLDGAAYSTYTGEPAGLAFSVQAATAACSMATRSQKSACTGVHLGGRGRGLLFGKKLLASFLYRALPQAIHDDFEEHYGLNKMAITKKVYQEPDANVFLASFMTFLGATRAIRLLSNG